MDEGGVMSCPQCGAETRPGQKFCAECGLALAAVCPNCGTPHEGSPKFCADCGFSLAGLAGRQAASAVRRPDVSQTAPPSAERRYVSILFADLVGFTMLSEEQDPEEVRDLLSRYFDMAREVIEGYGGTVEKFIGDAVMALWGAPVAREDDPERAVRAALELVNRVRDITIAEQPLALRAGVLSGEAAVSFGATGQGMVAGDLVNTASRLQSVAQPGIVLVGESTYHATSAAIAYEPAGEQVLKGKQAPVAAWRALRVVARVGGEGRDEGLEPPFVGRDEELRLLKEQLHAAEREHKLRMVAISGQAGIGKSRLIWELEKYLDGLAGQTYYWHQGRSPSYGEGVSFWALGEMVRRRARIAEGEDAESTRAKLQATLTDFVPDEQERRWLEPALGALLGLEEADWAAREQLFSAWRTFFERVADRGPTVLTFEDLQWADNGLLDFIEHLLEWARNKPIMIVTLARPELIERRPNFGMGHRALVAMHLEPLPPEAMTDLVRGLVPAIADTELAKIIERAEGVPLYAVETIRSLLDTGHCVRNGDSCELVGVLPTLDVPPTLRALISSRLDALEVDDRQLLQDASVIGQAFSTSALAALVDKPADQIDARLRVLAHKELVSLETDPRSPERGLYRFKQSLIREVAYATLSKRERRTRHLAAARYYDTLGDDELAGVLATHYLEAFKASPEGDEGAAVAAQAKVALRAAAERASRLHSHVLAMNYFEQAMAVSFDENDVNELREHAAKSAYAASRYDKAEEYLRAAFDWTERNEMVEETLELKATLGAWLVDMSRVDEAAELLTGALAKAPPDSSRAQIYLYGQLARALMLQAQPEKGLEAVSRALEIAERLNVPGPTLQLLITKSWALGQTGRFREGIALLTGAMTIADRENELPARQRSRFNLSSTVIIEDPHYALKIAREGIDIQEQYGFNSASMAGNAAEAELMIGHLDEVFRLEARASEVATVLGAFMIGNVGCAAALRGDWEGMRRRVAVVEQEAARSSSAQDMAELGRLRAFIAFAEGRLDDARSLALEAAEFYPGSTQQVFNRVLAGHAAALLGDINGVRSGVNWLAGYVTGAAWADRSRRTLEAAALALEGLADEAAATYRRVIGEWRDDEMPFDLGRTQLERALLLGGSDRDAAAGREEARRIFSAMGADGLVERLEAGGVKHVSTPAGVADGRATAPVQEEGAAPATR